MTATGQGTGDEEAFEAEKMPQLSQQGARESRNSDDGPAEPH